MKLLISYFVVLVFSATITLNPFKLTLLLVMSSVLLALVAMVAASKWIAFTLILFYLGGMMILFIYLVSLVVLEKFSLPSMKSLVAGLLLLSFVSSSNSSWSPALIYLGITSIYSTSSSLIPGLTLLLLVGLIAVIKVTGSIEGPLKSFTNA